MALNIKNPKSVALARELAQLTGESVTTAVRRILRLGREIARRLPDDVCSVDHGELLYDEAGLPT